MNKAEFTKWLESADGVSSGKLAQDFMHDEMDYWKEEDEGYPEELKGVEFTQVDSYGGEDCGSTYYSVYKFKLPNGEEFAIRFDGWYASYYGSEYESMYEVKPQEKVVTEWV